MIDRARFVYLTGWNSSLDAFYSAGTVLYKCAKKAHLFFVGG